MTCRGIDDVISARTKDSALPPEAAEHIAICERCRGLMRMLAETPEILPPSGTQVARIATRLIETLKPVRPLPSSRVLLCAVGVIFLAAAGVGALRLGVNGLSALSVDQKIAIFSTLTGGVLLLGLSIVRQMVPGSRHRLSPVGLPAVVLLSLALVIAVSLHPREERSFVATGIICLKNGLAYSVPAALLLWMLLRRGAVLFPKLAGAAAGGLAGLVGLSVLEVNCANVNVFHVLIWHWGVVLIGSLAGLAFGALAEQVERRSNRRIPEV